MDAQENLERWLTPHDAPASWSPWPERVQQWWAPWREQVLQQLQNLLKWEGDAPIVYEDVIYPGEEPPWRPWGRFKDIVTELLGTRTEPLYVRRHSTTPWYTRERLENLLKETEGFIPDIRNQLFSDPGTAKHPRDVVTFVLAYFLMSLAFVFSEPRETYLYVQAAFLLFDFPEREFAETEYFRRHLPFWKPLQSVLGAILDELGLFGLDEYCKHSGEPRERDRFVCWGEVDMPKHSPMLRAWDIALSLSYFVSTLLKEDKLKKMLEESEKPSISLAWQSAVARGIQWRGRQGTTSGGGSAGAGSGPSSRGGRSRRRQLHLHRSRSRRQKVARGGRGLVLLRRSRSRSRARRARGSL